MRGAVEGGVDGRGSLLEGLVEPAPREGDEMLDRLLCLGPGGANLDLVPQQGCQRRDSAQAPGRDRSDAGGEVAQLDRRVEGTHLADQAGSRSGVQPVRVLDREDSDDLDRADLVGVRGGVVRRRRQVRGLAHERVASLGRDLGPAGPTRRRDRGDDEAFDDRGRRESHAVPHRRVAQQVERKLGAQHGTAEIHEYDDAVGAVRPLDGLHDADRVGAEGRFVKTGGHLDPLRTAVQHLRGQRHRGMGQRAAVGDDDQPDAVLGVRLR